MIDELKQELLVDYLLNELDPESAERVRAEISADPEIREFVRETEEAYASIALAIPRIPAPAGLPRRILESERGAAQAQLPAPRSNIVWFAIPWALAACLAIACVVLGLDRANLQNKLAQTGREVLALQQNNARAELELATLQKKNALAEVKIMMLKAQVEAFESAMAVVVWDKDRKIGVLQLDKLPPAGPGRDYQLWVIDPKIPQPVSAGVFTVSSNGPMRTDFWPRSPVESASAFAISLEKAGGAPKPEGEIILAGN